jgi:amidase
MQDLAFRSARDLAAALRRREIGSLELLDHYLARVERWNPELGALVAFDVEGARARARAADEARGRGELWGPLHGLPMTIKDSIEVAGMPCTSGSPSLAAYVPAAHAPAVQRLVDAGAVVFGKTNLPLFAGDLQSYNEVYGTTRNPWDPARSPGGSSGGSAAALAAGLCGLELGSDIGGSIRSPSHFCGVYGHKPSHGIVPLRGHIPGPPGSRREDDLGVIGPLARAPEDLSLALDLLAGPPPLLAAFDAQAPALDPADDAFAAHIVRGAAQRHREWLAAHERRLALCARWEAFFRDFDVLLAPVLPTVAIPHDHGEISARTIEVNGKRFPYLEQIFWAGLASVALLPATVAPVGLGRSGLPVGLQIVGPFLEDRTPLDFAARMAEVVGGFVAPPGFA